MDLKTKLAVLDRIYRVYDDFIAEHEVACKKYCSTCCTGNVTATTLEGYKIIMDLIAGGQIQWYDNLAKGHDRKRFEPLITINELAELCMQGQEPPDETVDFRAGPCPLLSSGVCPLYEVRPFGCRCMVSRHDCRQKGYAEMDPLILYVNNVCLQYIEHIDAGGLSGNLTEILDWMALEKNRHAYRQNRVQNENTKLVVNRPIRVLMIPPEYRMKVEPLINAIRNFKMPML